MCFSEPLEQSAGYLEPSGYVLVGYKVVFKAGNLLMPWSPTHNAVIDDLDLRQGDRMFTTDHRYMRNFLNPTMFRTFIVSAFKDIENPVFIPHTLMTDKHGFHVANSEVSIINDSVNPFGMEEYRYQHPSTPLAYFPGDELIELEVRTGYRVKEPGVLCRVLIPASAVGPGNHAHAMVVIPPGEKETAADIALCEEYNAKHIVGRVASPVLQSSPQ